MKKSSGRHGDGDVDVDGGRDGSRDNSESRVVKSLSAQPIR